MVTVCQKCGDIGFSVALIYCDKCQIAAEHRYCLDKLPSTFTEHVTWFCEDCEPYAVESSPKTVIPIAPRKSNRLSRSENGTIKEGRSLVQRTSSAKPANAIITRQHDQKHLATKTSSDKPANAVMIGRSVRKPLDSRTVPKRKSRNGSVETTEVKKRESSPHQACETSDSEDHNSHHKATKQRRLATADNTNIDEKAESNESLKDHDLEESECVKTNTGQKADQAMSSKHQNQKLEEVESNKNKVEEAESRKIGVNKECEKQKSSTMQYEDNTDQDAESIKNITGDPENMSEPSIDVPAQPIVDAVWRGRFSIVDPKFNNIDGLAAHLSTKACLKVCEEARLLPDLLYADMLPRADIWPKSFRSSEPGDGHIALYFFPENESDERVFDNLVEYMIEEDFGMRAEAVNAELLVFTSIQLPLPYWRFQAKYYLWGVFRRKQGPVSRQPNGDVHNNSNESAVTDVSINPLAP